MTAVYTTCLKFRVEVRNQDGILFYLLKMNPMMYEI